VGDGAIVSCRRRSEAVSAHSVQRRFRTRVVRAGVDLQGF
jgi:hypothetical protein